MACGYASSVDGFPRAVTDGLGRCDRLTGHVALLLRNAAAGGHGLCEANPPSFWRGRRRPAGLRQRQRRLAPPPSPRLSSLMRMRKYMASRGFAALALALVVSACRDSTGPGLTGDFSGDVTGDQTKSLEGDAFFSFGSVFGEPETGFALLLLEGSALGENDDFILIGRSSDARPGVGTYDIVDSEGSPTASEFVAIWFPATGEEIDGEFVSTGGTLTITSSTSRRLRGTFEFDATGTMCDNPTLMDVTISGDFDAVFVDENGSPVSRITRVSITRAARH